VAITPIAPIGLQSRPCCANITQCEAVAAAAARPQCRMMTGPPPNNQPDISLTSLSFERLMLKAEPNLWEAAGWFSSHAYPCAGDGSGGPKDGCGLGGDPRPGTNGWNAPFATARPWLIGRPTPITLLITLLIWRAIFGIKRWSTRRARG
jgi:hypothetical protein